MGINGEVTSFVLSVLRILNSISHDCIHFELRMILYLNKKICAYDILHALIQTMKSFLDPTNVDVAVSYFRFNKSVKPDVVAISRFGNIYLFYPCRYSSNQYSITLLNAPLLSSFQASTFFFHPW